MTQPARVDASCRLLCVSPAEKISFAIPNWETTSLTSAFSTNQLLFLLLFCFCFFVGLELLCFAIILGDPGAISRVDKIFVVKVYCKIVSILQKTFTTNFLSTRLTAPGSPRMLCDINAAFFE